MIVGLDTIWGARCNLCDLAVAEPQTCEADALERLRQAHAGRQGVPGARAFVCQPGWFTSEVKVTPPVGETRHYPFKV